MWGRHRISQESSLLHPMVADTQEFISPCCPGPAVLQWGQRGTDPCIRPHRGHIGQWTSLRGEDQKSAGETLQGVWLGPPWGAAGRWECGRWPGTRHSAPRDAGPRGHCHHLLCRWLALEGAAWWSVGLVPPAPPHLQLWLLRQTACDQPGPGLVAAFAGAVARPVLVSCPLLGAPTLCPLLWLSLDPKAETVSVLSLAASLVSSAHVGGCGTLASSWGPASLLS